ncbi:MAG: 4Fe-4S dicluster domain-containing protein [Oligoflexia bacterium]|nr:4Fe-4S dicluster domain-containing protein [Oligoflexia bacterium]
MIAPILNNIISALFKKPFTVKYPFEKLELSDKHRGHIEIEVDKCIFCGICEKKCPAKAIIVTKTDQSWEIDRLSCITCNACVDVCPKKCLHSKTQWSPSQEKKGLFERFVKTSTAELTKS